MDLIRQYSDNQELNEILALVDSGQKESSGLCFIDTATLIKSKKKEEMLSMLISSFANANGGKIYLGLKSRRNKATALTFIDSDFLNSSIIKDIAVNKIYPPISDLKIETAFFENNPHKSLITITVERDNNSPYMAFDKRYYKRIGTQAFVMEEYEIREMYRKNGVSDIDFFGIINSGAVPVLENGKFLYVNIYPRFLIKNISSVIERDYKLELLIPSSLHNPNFDVLQRHFSRFEDKYTVFSITGKDPLFQNEIASVVEANLYLDSTNIKEFEKSEIHLKLYYSRGVKIKSFRMQDIFLYKNQRIKEEDFKLNNFFIKDN